MRQRPSDPLPGLAEEQISRTPFRKGLVMERVSYFYPGVRQAAIDDVSLEIPKGHWVAFIGPTGAGKTTLADVVLGLLIPEFGQDSGRWPEFAR